MVFIDMYDYVIMDIYPNIDVLLKQITNINLVYNIFIILFFLLWQNRKSIMNKLAFPIGRFLPKVDQIEIFIPCEV